MPRGHRKRGDQSNTIAVGSRVQTTDSPPKTGVVVEDFGDLAGVQVIIDRDHSAQSRRWAIMLDDGSLVFGDPPSLTVVDLKGHSISHFKTSGPRTSRSTAHGTAQVEESDIPVSQ